MLLPPALTVTLVIGAVPILLTLFLLFLRTTSEASTASTLPAGGALRAGGGGSGSGTSSRQIIEVRPVWLMLGNPSDRGARLGIDVYLADREQRAGQGRTRGERQSSMRRKSSAGLFNQVVSYLYSEEKREKRFYAPTIMTNISSSIASSLEVEELGS